jgi:uncharacterized protein
MNSVLLDTGAFVALLDRSEKQHHQCEDYFRCFTGTVLSTEPVLTETMYLLGPPIRAQRACIDFILQGGATLVPQSAESLERAAELMGKYRDVPMDFADATLVVLAEEMGIHEILTLDVRGFTIYRIHGRESFTIHP